MRKVKVKGQALICVILSCIGLVNLGVWIWMTGKTKQKKLRLTGIILLVACFAAIVMAAFVKNKQAETILSTATAILVIIPIAVNLMNLKTFINCQNLWNLVDENQIQVNELAEDAYADVGNCPDEFTIKNSRRLFGDKGEAVLRAIQFKEREKREIAEGKKREVERAKAEAKRMKAEKAKAEAEKARAEAEVKRLEAEKLREESIRIEAEKVKAEAEKARVEAAKIETEKAKAEAEKARAEAELKNLEMEREKAETEKQTQHKETQEEATVSQNIRNDFRKNNQKTDINLCTEQELSLIPGIGIILAKKAIKIRDEKGGFQSVDEFIQDVGIRENNVIMVKSSLVCEQPERYVEGSTRKRGRKIDL